MKRLGLNLDQELEVSITDEAFKDYLDARRWMYMMQQVDPDSVVLRRAKAFQFVLEKALIVMGLCPHLDNPDDCPDCRH